MLKTLTNINPITMDAKEILDLYLFTDNVEQFTEQLNAKLKEEAQERYRKALKYWRSPRHGLTGSDVDPAVQFPIALRIAAGIEGKEEG